MSQSTLLLLVLLAATQTECHLQAPCFISWLNFSRGLIHCFGYAACWRSRTQNITLRLHFHHLGLERLSLVGESRWCLVSTELSHKLQIKFQYHILDPRNHRCYVGLFEIMPRGWGAFEHIRIIPTYLLDSISVFTSIRLLGIASQLLQDHIIYHYLWELDIVSSNPYCQTNLNPLTRHSEFYFARFPELFLLGIATCEWSISWLSLWIFI